MATSEGVLPVPVAGVAGLSAGEAPGPLIAGGLAEEPAVGDGAPDGDRCMPGNGMALAACCAWRPEAADAPPLLAGAAPAPEAPTTRAAPAPVASPRLAPPLPTGAEGAGARPTMVATVPGSLDVGTARLPRPASRSGVFDDPCCVALAFSGAAASRWSGADLPARMTDPVAMEPAPSTTATASAIFNMGFFMAANF